jgi:glycosyltransferase involved in cell wall biosynthesis
MGWKIVSCLTSGRISGVDIFVVHLTEELRRRGHDARILLTRAGQSEVDAMPLPTDAPVDTLPPSARRKRRHRRRALREYLLSQGSCIYLPNYDFCHSPISARLPTSIHTVGILHSDDPMHYDHVRQLGRFWNRVVAVSSRIADVCREIRVPTQQLQTIPYGIPLPARRPPHDRTADDPLRLLYVGRIEQTQKRVLDMPLILDGLVARGVRAQLTIVGDGPLRATLETRAAEHIAAGRLRLLGTLPNSQVDEQYRNADVFLLTSAFEGLPVSLLEGMAHGCVPVVTRVESGVQEVIQPGINGEWAEVGDVAGFVRILADLQAHPARQQQLADAAYRTIADGAFSLSRMVDRYEDLFADMTQEVSAGHYDRPAPYPAELWMKEWQFRIERNWSRLRGRTRYRPGSPKS